jgi:hypothetical protein
MKRVKVVELCLVALFAMGMLPAASASAAQMPVYEVCKKASPKEGGAFNNKTCTEESKGGKKEGDFELGKWNEGKEASPKLKGRNGESVSKVYVPGLGVVGTVECKKAKSIGTIEGPSEASMTVTFEKCSSSGEVCTSEQAGEKSGDITTSLLTALLISVSKSPVIVATRMFPTSPATTLFTFKCGKTRAEVVGSVDGEDTGNVEKLSKDSTQTFATTPEGEEVINDEEGGTAGEDIMYATISGVGTLPSDEETTASLKSEEMEITVNDAL